jgi:hypothetical protein
LSLDPKLMVNEREVKPRNPWYKITAKEILEENDWPGKWIPIVKVIGDEIDIEGKVTRAGLSETPKTRSGCTTSGVPPRLS